MSEIGSSLNAFSSLAGALINYKSTQNQAKAAAEQAQKNRDFELEMANKQRADALADRAHSEMYNSPLMERMRREAAGLGPVDDYSTPGSSPQGLQPDYAEAASRSNDALVSAAQLGASSPMALMQGALQVAKTSAEIRKDNSFAAEASASAVVKQKNAELLKETFEDQVLKAKLENNYFFELTNKTIEEGNELVASTNLKKAERGAVLQQTQFAAQLQEWRVKQAKAEAELSENHVKITQYQLDKLLPAELKELEACAAELNARAYLSRREANRIDTLLPLEKKQLGMYIEALSYANQDAALVHDENIVKHNKFMSHLKEYEDSLVARYNLDAKTAHWYATNQFINIGSEIVGAGIKLYGIGKLAGSAGKAVAGMSAPLLYLPGTSQYEQFNRSIGYSNPPLQ